MPERYPERTAKLHTPRPPAPEKKRKTPGKKAPYEVTALVTFDNLTTENWAMLLKCATVLVKMMFFATVIAPFWTQRRFLVHVSWGAWRSEARLKSNLSRETKSHQRNWASLAIKLSREPPLLLALFRNGGFARFSPPPLQMAMPAPRGFLGKFCSF